ncbi:MAG: D-aminoacyl-tRNA deacylase, partial [Terriglobales bacterium]
HNLVAAGGAVLAVSQFTLLGDASRGHRPSFAHAARPEAAQPLFDHLVLTLRGHGCTVCTGVFAAHMEVELINDGPVTIWLDSRAVERAGR